MGLKVKTKLSFKVDEPNNLVLSKLDLSQTPFSVHLFVIKNNNNNNNYGYLIHGPLDKD